MSDCNLERERLLLYLDGVLRNAEAEAVESHVEQCATCQSLEVIDAELAALIRRKLPVASASPALRGRVLASLEAEDGPAAARVADLRESWSRRLFASPWLPRLVMAAVLAFLLLVPVRGLFRPPALAQAAIERHGCHADGLDGADTPPCCHDLMLSVGALLQAPSAGQVVPDLGTEGLKLIATTHCEFDDTAVNMLAYRASDAATFSLYITDRVTEQFMQLSVQEVNGMAQARHRVKESEVTIWKRDGLIYFWVGPHDSPSYDQALARLLEP
ncbi:MAG: zf-HC2 domain-containing protein [Candidatus Latescibacterota bacterium]|nr:MAG: zf-HC2 domain-containing protein [Candidatus Latescibacterota bacterium]